MSTTPAANAKAIFTNKIMNETLGANRAIVGAVLRDRPIAGSREAWGGHGGPPLQSFVSLVIVLLACVGTGTAQTNRSVYTPLGEKQCRGIKSAKSENDDFSARCPGIAGYKLIFSEGDLRQNISVVTPKGAEHSLELWSVVSSGFSTIGPKVEWRLAKATPVALIIRYNTSEDAASPNKNTSYLAVAKITPSEICVTDKITPGPNANEDARRAADSATTKPCLKDHK